MFHPGDVIGPYTLVRTLGRGAYGEVWLADRASSLLTTQVALKLPLDSDVDLDVIRREAQSWLRASGHPNVVPVLEAEVFDGQVVIASEYIAGGSLADLLSRNGGEPASPEVATKMAVGILEGLAHLHEMGLVHRDLKPANVLLQRGVPRLTDFGLARALKSESRSSGVAGTPHYMAPEAFRGEYSVASDLWAVGVILHEMIAGTLPFPDGDFYSLLLAITGDAPVVLSDRVPDSLRPILSRAMAKSAGDRFFSAQAMAEALRSGTAASASRSNASLPKPDHNLPVQVTSFIGRAREMAETRDLLGKTRLLTLTGAGGCGKTRLALQLADEVRESFADGVWYVELAALTDPDLVPQTAADILGVRESPGTPITLSLVEALREKRLLLLLDNCEHVLESAARFSDTLLRTCPGLTALVTSREALGIGGESAYRVPSLSVPDAKEPETPESLARYEAVSLFTERAISARADFEVTVRNAPALASVCRRLDGIPLALELAAARVRAMPVEQIDSRLNDRFRLLTGGSRTALPRQQTLRALVDWSFSLLSAEEQAMLCRLSVFNGGWTLEAAETLCAGERTNSPAGADTLDLLTSLVDKSLVIYEEGEEEARYRLLETVRQYGRDRLEESGESESVRRSHQAFFAELVELAEPHMRGPDQALWLRRLDREHDNLRSAIEGQDTECTIRILSVLWWFWYIRGFFHEGRDRLARGLARVGESAQALARAKSLNGAGVLAYSQADYESARQFYLQSLTHFREANDKERTAALLNNLGMLHYEQGDYGEARRLNEESLALRRELGDKQSIAASLNNLGLIAQIQEDPEAARIWHSESLILFREAGDRGGEAYALFNIANIAFNRGENAEARRLCEECLAIRRELNDTAGVGYALIGAACAAYGQRDFDTARAVHEESLGLFEAVGDKRGIGFALFNLANTIEALGDWTEAHSMFRKSLEIFRDIGQRQGIAGVLEALATGFAARGHSCRAARLWGAAEALREKLGFKRPPFDREPHARRVAEARATVGEEAFTAAWNEGRAVTMDQAIEYAVKGDADLNQPPRA